jgi:hypothetical protein
MNLFVLHPNPIRAAEWMCDKHVVKMILEVAQMLSTAHRELESSLVTDDCLLYKKTHLNHPSTIWCRTTGANYHWAYVHMIALCDEYTKRYGKTHLTDTKLRSVLCHFPEKLLDSCRPKDLTIPPSCMPDKYFDRGNQVSKTWKGCSESYQRYYQGEKAYMLTYKYSDTPKFLQGVLNGTNRVISDNVSNSR